MKFYIIPQSPHEDVTLVPDVTKIVIKNGEIRLLTRDESDPKFKMSDLKDCCICVDQKKGLKGE